MECRHTGLLAKGCRRSNDLTVERNEFVECIQSSIHWLELADALNGRCIVAQDHKEAIEPISSFAGLCIHEGNLVAGTLYIQGSLVGFDALVVEGSALLIEHACLDECAGVSPA